MRLPLSLAIGLGAGATALVLGGGLGLWQWLDQSERLRAGHATAVAAAVARLERSLMTATWNTDDKAISDAIAAELHQGAPLRWIWVQASANDRLLGERRDDGPLVAPGDRPTGTDVVAGEIRHPEEPDRIIGTLVAAPDNTPLLIELRQRRNELVLLTGGTALSLALATGLFSALLVRRRLSGLADSVATAPEAQEASVSDGDHLDRIVATAGKVLQRLGAVLASIGDGVIAADADGRVRRANPAAIRLLRMDPTGTSLDDTLARLHPGANATTRLLEGPGEEWRVERDGILFVTAQRIRAAGAGTVVVLRDLTALRSADAEVAAQRARLQSIVDGAELGLWEWDLETGAMEVNDRWALMLGRDPAALRPLRHGTWDELCHPDDHPGATAALQRHLDGTTSFFERELRLRHADGRWVWVLTRGQVLRRDGQGHPLAMGGTTLDITARKHAEQVLTRSRDELERLVAERTAALRESQRRLTDAARQAGMAQVAAGILHNVGNVLTAVVAVVEQLRNEARRPLALRSAELLALVLEAPDATRFLTSDERGRKVPEIWQRLSPALDRERQAYALHLEELHRHVQHIVAIVASQQRYATGQFLIEPCDARDLLHEALTLAAPALARCGAHTCLHAPDAAPLATDRHHVVDALAAGLVNAAEAVADAEDRLVLIAIHHHHGGVSMTITDHGCGFPPQLQPRLFQHGFTTKPGHRGFAMHTAAANLRSIGGAISLTSPGLGLGAVCTITLPHERSSGT